MRRRRLEAWVNEYLDRDFTSFRTADEARKWAAQYGKAERLAVRLVECGPGEVVVPKAVLADLRRVVRAAVAYARRFRGDGYGEPAHVNLLRAVEHMKGRKR